MTIDFTKLWEALWIENLEEEINKTEKKIKQRQEEINKKYPITKEDILMFSNLFYKVRFDKITRWLLPSEILTTDENVIIPFWNRNEIASDIAKDKFILLLKFVQRVFILMDLNWYKIHDNSEKNKLVWNLLEMYRIKKWDPRTRNFIKPKWYWETFFMKKSFLQKIISFLKWGEKVYEIKRDNAKFFIYDLLDERIGDFIENIDYWIDFNIQVYDKNLFVWWVLSEIEKFSSKIEKAKQIENIFKEIKEQISNKENYPTSILLTYPLSDYTDSKTNYYDIIRELHEKEYLTVKELYIFEGSVNFVIEKINRFTPDIINKLFPIYERISFEWWVLRIDSVTLTKSKKEWDKIYELIDIIVLGIKKYKRLEISYSELKKIFIENIERFPYFYKTINIKNKYKNVLNRLENEKNEENIWLLNSEKEKIVDKVFCLEFYNSSLVKENANFILNKNTTWLLINEN